MANLQPIFHKATTKLLNRNYQEAINDFHKIIQKKQHKESLIYLAMCYEGLGQFDTAKKYYDQAQQITPVDLSHLPNTVKYSPKDIHFNKSTTISDPENKFSKNHDEEEFDDIDE